MPNSLAIIRALLIYGLCLPAAIFLGYLLATPLDWMSFVLILLLVFVPLVPVLLRWHHFLLIASWNLSAVLFFLPGRPFMWVVMTFISLVLSTTQRILSRETTHISVPSVARPLLFLLLVTFATALLTGGIGVAALGSEVYGGRRYIMILAAVLGFFAMSRVRVPPGRETLYASVFFLMGITAIIGALPGFIYIPPALYFLFAIFPIESLQLVFFDPSEDAPMRLSSLAPAGNALVCYCLARYGLRGTLALNEGLHLLPFRFRGSFQIQQPWRLILVLLALWVGLSSGFRSALVFFMVLFAMMFFMEGLHRSPALPALILVGLLGAAVVVPFASKLPPNVQRALSFLPLDIDPVIRMNADYSTEWRVQMWQSILPSVPKYLLLGKGYAIDPTDLERAQYGKAGESALGAMIAGDYHNGPLTLLIPLGIWGAIAFLWFLVASFRVLWNNYRYGDPALHRVNSFLLVYFVARTLFYFFVFGSFSSELYLFTGVVALSISLNGGVRQPVGAPAVKPVFGTLPLARATQ
ncbi:MAG: O-antigen ligase family protein [Verrucomicrobiales bacterium]|nr:O-antigen ligase family protein [Verrucomicrobiales bacterium]